MDATATDSRRRGDLSGGSARRFVGNDVVDLSDAEALGKAQDSRFVERVLAAEERARFDAARSDWSLWCLWSAKESAFKALQKALGVSPAARSLVVANPPPEPAAAVGTATSFVTWNGSRVAVHWHFAPEAVHCIATFRDLPEAGDAERVTSSLALVTDPELGRSQLTAAEALGARNPASNPVRELARGLFCEAAGRGELRPFVEIRRAQRDAGLGPPELFLKGERLSGWDLSLSHHGRFVAAAVCRTAEPAGDGELNVDASECQDEHEDAQAPRGNAPMVRRGARSDRSVVPPLHGALVERTT